MMTKKSSSARLVVRVLQLPHASGLPLPDYQTAGSAGVDLMAAVPDTDPLTIAPGTWAAVPTGLSLELPADTEAQVRPRSGLAARHGVTVLNAPGTIDSDYRGEVKVLMVNLGREPFTIQRGERIAQMVVQPVLQVRLVGVEALSATGRGAGGFGSTGRTAKAPRTAKKRTKAKAAARSSKETSRGPRKR